MKVSTTVMNTVALSAFTVGSAFASATGGTEVDTTLTYNSGILVLAFAGFLALVVVVQTVPAFISLYNMIKKTAEESKRQAVKATARD